VQQLLQEKEIASLVTVLVLMVVDTAERKALPGPQACMQNVCLLRSRNSGG